MHRCSTLTLVYLSCASHHLIAKSCFAMQPFLSVYPVYDSPYMTWTVYWTLILRRLPTLILPALFTDYPECLPPAPIQSLSSDSDSALPTLRLKLVIKLCLSDLHTLLIKLHMDPNALDSSLHYPNKPHVKDYLSIFQMMYNLNKYIINHKIGFVVQGHKYRRIFSMYSYILAIYPTKPV